MAKFRKKPEVIEAVHYDGTPAGYEAVCAFAPGVSFYPSIWTPWSRFFIPRTMVASGDERGGGIVYPGDWIIRGTEGELYPCKPDIFVAIYDPA